MFEITMQGITIGPVRIAFYSVMILLGLFAGILLARREAKRLGEDPDHVLNIAVLGAVFGIIGARLYHVVHEWGYYSVNPGQIVAVWTGGLGIFGAIAGAALALMTYVWWVNRQARSRRGSGQQGQPMRVLRWFDIAAPAFLLGQAIGRWGNFFNQELHGPPTDLPWGIPINNPPPQFADATHFHPLFLYESILSFIGVLVLLYIARRLQHRLRDGDILLGYFIWYSGVRFFYEFLRIDPWTLGPIPMAQVLSIMLIIAAVSLLVWRHRQPAPPVLPKRDTPEDAQSRSRTAQRRQRRRGTTGLHG